MTPVVPLPEMGIGAFSVPSWSPSGPSSHCGHSRTGHSLRTESVLSLLFPEYRVSELAWGLLSLGKVPGRRGSGEDRQGSPLAPATVSVGSVPSAAPQSKTNSAGFSSTASPLWLWLSFLPAPAPPAFSMSQGPGSTVGGWPLGMESSTGLPAARHTCPTLHEVSGKSPCALDEGGSLVPPC